MRIKIVGSGRVAADESKVYSPSPLSWDEVRRTSTGRLPPAYASAREALLQRFPRFQFHDPATQYALVAAEAAVDQAGWTEKDFDVFCGCSRGPTSSWEAAHTDFYAGEGLRPQTSPLTTLGTLGFALADRFDQSGLAATQSVTCSSGLHALLQGVAFLRSGLSQRVLVGGTEAPLTGFTFAQLDALRILNRERGALPYRPLAEPARGMCLGEGAAFFCLTSEDEGTSSGFEIRGIGFAREGHASLSGIQPEGIALQSAMRQAVEAAGGTPDLIIPHAPGTRAGDAAEVHAIRAIFGTPPPVYSGKWATGHTFGASGPLALDTALRILETGAVPSLPYALGYGLEECRVEPRRIMVNATGFGGNGVSVVVEAPNPQRGS